MTASTWRSSATPAQLAAAATRGVIVLNADERRRVWQWLGEVAARLAAQRHAADLLAGAR